MPIEPGGKNPDPTDPGGKNPGGTNPGGTNSDPTDTEAPAVVSGATFGDLNVIVWANPTDADFSGVLILRNTSSIVDVPSAGEEYTVGGDIGGSEVVQSANSSDFGVSAATVNTAYYYKIFAYDASHNYAAGVEIEATKSSDKIIFVNAAANGTDDGTSWSNAYSSLNLALTSSAGTNKIVVAKGIYKPTSTTSDRRDATFQLKSNVKVYGGFDVADTLLSERNWRVNKTILSGDIDNNDTVNADGVTETTNRVMTGSTTVTSDIKGNNVYTVVTGAANTTLDGFTITAGQSNGTGQVRSNGGGLYNLQGNNLILSNIIFSGNRAAGLSAGSATGGGGMFSSASDDLTLSNVIFSGNKSNDAGGGLFIITGLRFILSNVIFSGNKADFSSGGMRNNGTDVTLNNVIFSGNTATSNGGGGGMVNTASGLILINVIMWDNTATACTGGSPQGNMNFCNRDSADTVTISHSLIQDCSDSTVSTDWWTGSNSCASGNTGNNIDAADDDLLFADADGVDNVFGTLDDDLSLMMGSPAIDAGSNGPTGTPLFPAGALDLAGKPRIVKGKSASAGPLIDMGAYEYQPMPPL